MVFVVYSALYMSSMSWLSINGTYQVYTSVYYQKKVTWPPPMLILSKAEDAKISFLLGFAPR
jgi:hypothetical protein